MLVVVTGPQFGQWLQIPVGTRVAVNGRLEAAGRGSDVAAVLRGVRGSPLVVERLLQGFASWSGYAPDCGEQSLIAHRRRGGWCQPWCWATPPVSMRI